MGEPSYLNENLKVQSVKDGQEGAGELRSRLTLSHQAMFFFLSHLETMYNIFWAKDWHITFKFVEQITRHWQNKLRARSSRLGALYYTSDYYIIRNVPLKLEFQARRSEESWQPWVGNSTWLPFLWKLSGNCEIHCYTVCHVVCHIDRIVQQLPVHRLFCAFTCKL